MTRLGKSIAIAIGLAVVGVVAYAAGYSAGPPILAHGQTQLAYEGFNTQMGDAGTRTVTFSAAFTTAPKCTCSSPTAGNHNITVTPTTSNVALAGTSEEQWNCNCVGAQVR